MDQTVSLYKNINFNQFLKGVELEYSGPPRIDPSVAQSREKEAYERGRQEATDVLNEQILHNRREVQQLLGETLEGLNGKFDLCMKDVLEGIPELVTNIARRVLAEIELDGAAIKAIVDDVVGDLPSNKDQVEVFLSPRDLEQFNYYIENLNQEYSHCQFFEDSKLGPADCRVESKFGAIDATVETKLKHIEEQLRS